MQVTNNVQVALEEGVAGVFIVNHDFDYPQMLPILRQVRGRFPDAFLGVNFHMMNGAEAFPILGRLACEGIKIDAFWADNACIDAHSIDQVPATHTYTLTHNILSFTHLLFVLRVFLALPNMLNL